jgi:hypothetical protein
VRLMVRLCSEVVLCLSEHSSPVRGCRVGSTMVNERTSCLTTRAACVAMLDATAVMELVEVEGNNRVSRNDDNAQEEKNYHQMGRHAT